MVSRKRRENKNGVPSTFIITPVFRSSTTRTSIFLWPLPLKTDGGFHFCKDKGTLKYAPLSHRQRLFFLQSSIQLSALALPDIPLGVVRSQITFVSPSRNLPVRERSKRKRGKYWRSRRRDACCSGVSRRMREWLKVAFLKIRNKLKDTVHTCKWMCN